jgi:hypothetical protein
MAPVMSWVSPSRETDITFVKLLIPERLSVSVGIDTISSKVMSRRVVWLLPGAWFVRVHIAPDFPTDVVAALYWVAYFEQLALFNRLPDRGLLFSTNKANVPSPCFPVAHVVDEGSHTVVIFKMRGMTGCL